MSVPSRQGYNKYEPYVGGGGAGQNQSGGSLIIQEQDGSPSVTVTTLIVPNGSLTDDGGGQATFTPSGTGDVVGPASATDNAIARYDGTTGKLIQDSLVTISDTGAIDGAISFNLPFTTTSNSGVYKVNGGSFIHLFTNADALASEASAGRTNAYNIAIGVEAGTFTSSGSAGTVFGGRNIAIGYRAGQSNTTGWQNTFVGFISGQKTTTGIYNTGLGAYTLVENTTGDNNTGIGADALWLNTTGNDNTAIGTYAGQQNTTGSNNSSLGKDAMRNNTTGADNTGLGWVALRENTTASNNTAVGSAALRNTTTGHSNTAVGRLALNTNVTGNFNTALGATSLQNVTNSHNTAVGYGTGDDITTGAENTIIGSQSGTALTTGSNNIFVGRSAGGNVTTGSNNLIVGYNTNADSATASNQLNIAGIIKGDTNLLNLGLAGASLVTTATDGFPYIPGTAGTPTGVPTGMTGRVPLVVDTTNNVLYFYSGAQWRSTAAGGGGTTINPTDNRIPYRSNATTFADSPLYTDGSVIGLSETSPAARLQISTVASGNIGLIVKGVASQTGDLQQWRDNANTVRAKVEAAGTIVFGAIPGVIGNAVGSYPSFGYNIVPSQSVANQFTYRATDVAYQIQMGLAANRMSFQFAPSGTAGNTITFTEAFNIWGGTNGWLGIGGTHTPVTIVHIKKSQSGATTLGDSRMLILDNSSGGNGQLLEIGIGYKNVATTYQPAIIGHRITANSNFTKGDIYFATRDVETDTAPSERFTILAAGQCKFAVGIQADGGGFKHARVTTGSVTAGATALVTITWTTAFADANYTVVASVLEATTSDLSLKVVHIESITSTAVTVRVKNDGVGSLTGTVQVIAVHD